MSNEKRTEKKGSLAQIDLGHEVNEAIGNLDIHADEVREKEYRLRESRRGLEHAKDTAKQVLIANNVLDALKIDMNFIRKHSQN